MGIVRLTYTTEDEINYIKNIRSFEKNITRLDKLKLYRNNILKRKNWGEIDSEKSIQFLNSEIIKEHNNVIEIQKSKESSKIPDPIVIDKSKVPVPIIIDENSFID